jgi:uncharacterized membrane protein
MIENIIMIIVGIFAVVFSNKLARLSIDFQGSFYRVKLGSNVVNFVRVLFVLVGASFVVLGVLATFDVIRF